MKILLKIIFTGLVVMIVAFFANFLGSILGLASWYDVIRGNLFFRKDLFDYLWLIIFYPFMIGSSAYFAGIFSKKVDILSKKQAIGIFSSALFFLIFIILILFSQQQRKIDAISTFDECQKAGFPVAEIFPEQCYLPDGRSFTKSTEVACTMDAKLCPDGSYVGRTSPDCEFAPCPGN